MTIGTGWHFNELTIHQPQDLRKLQLVYESKPSCSYIQSNQPKYKTTVTRLLRTAGPTSLFSQTTRLRSIRTITNLERLKLELCNTSNQKSSEGEQSWSVFIKPLTFSLYYKKTGTWFTARSENLDSRISFQLPTTQWVRSSSRPNFF